MTTERLNIRSDSPNWRAAILSDPAHAPFTIGLTTFLSVESALQGIKFADEKRRNEVFAMSGLEALKAGREITKKIASSKKSCVHWDDQFIICNSNEHRLLIALFIHEKIRQNKIVREALLATKGSFIYHDVGPEHPSTSLPEKFYIQILLSQRDLLQKLLQISKT